MEELTYDEFVNQMRANFDRQDVYELSENAEDIAIWRDSDPDEFPQMIEHLRRVLLDKTRTYQNICLHLTSDECDSEEEAKKDMQEVWQIMAPGEPFPERDS